MRRRICRLTVRRIEDARRLAQCRDDAHDGAVEGLVVPGPAREVHHVRGHLLAVGEDECRPVGDMLQFCMMKCDGNQGDEEQ